MPDSPSGSVGDVPIADVPTAPRRGRGVGRDQLLQLRCSSAERTRWRAKADASGVSVSAMLRDALDAARPRRRRRTVADPALLRELGRIGNNLNQLARWANREKRGVSAVAVLARLVEIDRELRALREGVQLAVARAGPAIDEDADRGRSDGEGGTP